MLHLARLLVGQEALGAVRDPAHRAVQLARQPSRPARIPAARPTSCRTSRRHRPPARGSPSACILKLPFAMPLRRLNGDWCAACTSMRPSAPSSAQAPRGSIELAVTRETVNVQLRHMRRCRAARHRWPSASPRFHRKPILSGYVVPHRRRAGLHGRDGIGHQRQRIGNPPSPHRRLPAPRRGFPPRPPRPVRRRNGRDRRQAADGRSSRAGPPSGRGKPMPPGIGSTSVRSACGIDADDAGHGARRRGVDAGDGGMRMRRMHQRRDQHAVALAVGGVIATAGQQLCILAPLHRSRLHCRHSTSPSRLIGHSVACLCAAANPVIWRSLRDPQGRSNLPRRIVAALRAWQQTTRDGARANRIVRFIRSVGRAPRPVAIAK